MSSEEALAILQAAKSEGERRPASTADGAQEAARGHENRIEGADAQAEMSRAAQVWRAEAVRAAAEAVQAGVEDQDATINVRRPAGPFLRPDRPVAGTPGEPAASHAPASPGHPQAPEGFPWSASPHPSGDPVPAASGKGGKRGLLAVALLRVGDIPIKVVYGIGAAIVTALIVVLIFTVFSEDQPGDPVRVSPVQGADPASPSTSAEAKPEPAPIVVPAVPTAKAMTVFTGSGSTIASYVLDKKSGITYARYGAPWSKTSRSPFSAAQKAGPAQQQALIASAPLPGVVKKAPVTYADHRALAAKAAKWTLRYQPGGAAFTWTVSQRARYNLGWLVGYKVSYVVGGKRHSSQAYVMVISTANQKPALLFATIPDTRKSLHRDLNMLFWTARSS